MTHAGLLLQNYYKTITSNIVLLLVSFKSCVQYRHLQFQTLVIHDLLTGSRSGSRQGSRGGFQGRTLGHPSGQFCCAMNTDCLRKTWIIKETVCVHIIIYIYILKVIIA